MSKSKSWFIILQFLFIAIGLHLINLDWFVTGAYITIISCIILTTEIIDFNNLIKNMDKQ